MKCVAVDLPEGRVHAWGARADLAHAAADLLQRLARDASSVARAEVLAGQDAWIKGGPPRAGAPLRYGLRWRTLRRWPPRGREARNLIWLSARLFRTSEALAAAWRVRGARMEYQLLVTRRIADAEPLQLALDRERDAARRAAWLEELAFELARMHALAFVHGDAYLRNVLLAPPSASAGDPRRLVLLDAWRGGPHAWGRSDAHDLGCLMLEGAQLLDLDEQRRFFRTYLTERAEQGRACAVRPFLKKVARARERELERLWRQPERWRLSDRAPVAWDARALDALSD